MVGSQEQREKLSIRKPWQGENRFLERVFNHPEFQKLYRARMEEFSKTIFSPERLAAQVDEIARVIRPAVAQESAEKLARFDKVVAGEEVPPRFFGAPGGGNRGPGGGRPGFGPFGQGMKPIKTFSKARHQSVLEQLAGKSQGETLEFGFPGRGGPGRGPGGFGPGMFLAGAFNAQLDADRNGEVSKDEFKSGMARWFSDWDEKKEGVLTEEQLREGLNRTFRPPVPPE
jgi:hypothetical protein